MKMSRRRSCLVPEGGSDLKGCSASGIRRGTTLNQRLLKHVLRRARLGAVASDAVALTGYTAFHGGDLVKADGWFRRAIDLARQAKDPRLEASRPRRPLGPW